MKKGNNGDPHVAMHTHTQVQKIGAYPIQKRQIKMQATQSEGKTDTGENLPDVAITIA